MIEAFTGENASTGLAAALGLVLIIFFCWPRQAPAKKPAPVTVVPVFGPPEPADPNRVFSTEELEKYGSKGSRIYMGCKGVVFDVTESGFYGPQGGYQMLSGRDASLALAKMDLVYADSLTWVDISCCP